MSQPTVTLELSAEAIATLDEIASNMETDRAAVLREAIELYLADYRSELEETHQGDLEFEVGETIAHEDVFAWLESQHPRNKESEAA